MIGYKDRTYCGSDVEVHTCGREFTEQDAKEAEKWWGGKDYPVAYIKFCEEEPKGTGGTMTPTEQDNELDLFSEEALKIAEALRSKYPNTWELLYNNNAMPEVIAFTTANYIAKSELENKKPSRGAPRLGAALTIIADIRSVYPISTFSGTTQDELVEFIAANYIAKSDIESIAEKAESINIEYNGRPDCKNCSILEELAILLGKPF